MRFAWFRSNLFATAALATGAAAPAGTAAGPDNLTISLEGDCPGRISVQWEGATPDRWAVVFFAYSVGEFTLPNDYCEDTVLGINSGLRVAKYFRTGSQGQGELAGRATAHACAGYVQVMGNGTPPCPLSNVVQLPE